MKLGGRTLSGVQALLAQTALALLAVFVLEVAWSLLPPRAADTGGDVARIGVAVDMTTLPRFSLPPKDAFRDVLERPLFEESRRGTFHASKEAPSTSRAGDLELVGIVISSEETFALVKAGGASPSRVGVGSVLDGWEISEIAQDSILVSRGPEQERLYLPGPG